MLYAPIPSSLSGGAAMSHHTPIVPGGEAFGRRLEHAGIMTGWEFPSSFPSLRHGIKRG